MLWKMETAARLFYCLFIPTREWYFLSEKPPPELPMKGSFCKKHNFPSLLSFPCENALSFGSSGGGQEG